MTPTHNDRLQNYHTLLKQEVQKIRQSLDALDRAMEAAPPSDIEVFNALTIYALALASDIAIQSQGVYAEIIAVREKVEGMLDAQGVSLPGD